MAAENAYDPRDLCDHDTDCEGRTAGEFEDFLIHTSADLAPGGDGVTRQAPVPDERRAREHRGCPEESLSRICGDAQPGNELSHDLRTGKIKTLHAWMKKADAYGLYRMQRFVRRLKQDQSAVEAAVESWSNGPVEGHINRLKTLKRQMYGRAGFELLRARVVPLRLLPFCTKGEEEPFSMPRRQGARLAAASISSIDTMISSKLGAAPKIMEIVLA